MPRDYAGLAERYALDATQCDRQYGKWTRLAAQRHLNDLKRKGWNYVFSPQHAADVCDFIEKLPHIEGRWETPTIQLQPAQIFILSVLFGWRRKSDGLRRFSSAYIEMARKNAKSTLTAGVVLYCLTCENEPGPQIFIGATTGDQARKVFDPAAGMVRRTPALQEAFGLRAFAHSITCSDNGGYVKPINAKASTQDGHNPHMGVLDELHAHKDRGLFDVLRSADGARSNPMLWMITTAGYSTVGVCYEQHTLVKKILEGVVEADHYFGIIYSIDENDDPYDETVWSKANPLLGASVKLDSLKRYAIEAKANPGQEGEFKTKRLNVWLNAYGAWLNMAQWQECADTSLDWDAFDGLDCYAGADLADKDDITALVLIGVKGDLVLAKPIFWLPQAVLANATHSEGRGPAPYRSWSRQEHIRLTEGDWVDHNEIEEIIRGWKERYTLHRVTFDQFAAAQAMASRLNADGDPDRPFSVILHKSAPNVTDPAKDLEARVKSKRLIHDGNPVMTWMASNTVVSRRVDGSMIPKKESPESAAKIDGIDALVNALHPIATFNEEPGPSFWEN